MGRVVTALVGLGAMLLSLYGALWVTLSAAITAQRPDPTVPDDDPCCTYPDTWHEVADGAWQTPSAKSRPSIDASVSVCQAPSATSCQVSGYVQHGSPSGTLGSGRWAVITADSATHSAP